MGSQLQATTMHVLRVALRTKACLMGLQMAYDALPTSEGNSPGSLQQPGAATEQGSKEVPARPLTCPNALCSHLPGH